MLFKTHIYRIRLLLVLCQLLKSLIVVKSFRFTSWFWSEFMLFDIYNVMLFQVDFYDTVFYNYVLAIYNSLKVVVLVCSFLPLINLLS